MANASDTSQMANASDRSLREDILRREGWEQEYRVYSNSTQKDEEFEEYSNHVTDGRAH